MARSSGSSKASQDDPKNLQDMRELHSSSTESSSLVDFTQLKCHNTATSVG
jgi:hypothetical protein